MTCPRCTLTPGCPSCERHQAACCAEHWVDGQDCDDCRARYEAEDELVRVYAPLLVRALRMGPVDEAVWWERGKMDHEEDMRGVG